MLRKLIKTSNFDEDSAEAPLKWFREHGVAYPWADSSDSQNAWGIWVSEVMLQQTTVAAVEPRYRRWMKRFPTPEALAAADEEEVLREWEGLGYYNRARNLAAAAGEIRTVYGGRIPEEYAELRRLPGIGEYIAAALASFAFAKRRAAIDANGRRIAQRLSARDSWDKKLETEFRKAVEELMPLENPGEMNAALMQLGQRVCTPRFPRCGDCPLACRCLARLEGRQESIPSRRRQEVIHKKTRLAILFDGGRVLMRKRMEGIGRGLWDFPAESEIGGLDKWWEPVEELPEQVHTYTRYREVLQPRIYRRNKHRGKAPLINLPEKCYILPVELQDLPMPTAYRRISLQLPDLLIYL